MAHGRGTRSGIRTCRRGASGLAGRPERFDTDRLEASSDGVLSITITLLVFQITTPVHPPRGLLPTLLAQWPTYAAFLYVGVIWLNHKSVFARVTSADCGLHLANLLVLLTLAPVLFPTTVLATALQAENAVDARIAVALYALVAGAMCAA